MHFDRDMFSIRICLQRGTRRRHEAELALLAVYRPDKGRLALEWLATTVPVIPLDSLPVHGSAGDCVVGSNVLSSPAA
jgi:hypothetical protein